MGWSCTARAAYVLDAIRDIVRERYHLEINNGLPVGFWETGREHADGHISGTCWRNVDEKSCRRSGSFYITPDGRVRRFSGLPADIQREAEGRGTETYQRIHVRGAYLIGGNL